MQIGTDALKITWQKLQRALTCLHILVYVFQLKDLNLKNNLRCRPRFSFLNVHYDVHYLRCTFVKRRENKTISKQKPIIGAS